MNIIELAKEAGFTGCLLPEEADDLIGGVFIDDENWIKPLERFAGLVRAEREWVDLTDDECLDAVIRDGILDCLADPYDKFNTGDSYGSLQYDSVRAARAVIAVFKEKNT